MIITGLNKMARIGNQEQYYLNRLQNLAPDAEWVAQYHIKPYFIDFYSKVHNIAIEYDELHHDGQAQKRSDYGRQQDIESRIGCKFYRYPQNCPIPFWDFVERIMVRY